MSPYKKDTVKQRNPDFPTQLVKNRRLIYYDTIDEMWVGVFKRYHTDLYKRYKESKRLNTAPKVFHLCKLFETTKGGNVSCLCINCEGFNCLMRGFLAAIKIIKSVLKWPEGSRHD
mmetsp:Transcript_24010/g.70829  ORF Transcript_24010/g.70829 Transcript_24010/m.70829 type:complete len:116 (-) Transcript_24010:2428-2775(-)